MQIVRPKYSTMSDEQLMIHIAKGNKGAFDEIYERYAGPMRGYFYRMLWQDFEKSEDFVHDLFAKIIRKPELFDPSRKFKTWLYSVANNMCKNEYKKQEVRKNMSTGLENHSALKDQSSNVFGQVADSQFKEAFGLAMNELADKHKEVFRLRHLDGLSIKEIVEILGISSGTVKSRLFYATKYLADKLQAFNPVMNQ